MERPTVPPTSSYPQSPIATTASSTTTATSMSNVATATATIPRSNTGYITSGAGSNTTATTTTFGLASSGRFRRQSSPATRRQSVGISGHVIQPSSSAGPGGTPGGAGRLAGSAAGSAVNVAAAGCGAAGDLTSRSSISTIDSEGRIGATSLSRMSKRWTTLETAGWLYYSLGVSVLLLEC